MATEQQTTELVHHNRAQKPQVGLESVKAFDDLLPGMLDSIGIMAGAANVVMQLSHASVGYGVMLSRVKGGALFKQPMRRARTTLTYLAVSMTGTVEEKMAYRKAINQQHMQVKSEPGDRISYDAMNSDLQLWVASCIYFGYADARRKLRPHDPLSAAQEAQFYQLSRALGNTLLVNDDQWPASIEAFDAYFQGGLAKADIDDTLRGYLLAIVHLKFLNPVLRFFFADLNRFLTTGFLPPLLRKQLRLTWSETDERRFHRMVSIIGRINALLPRFIRQLPIDVFMAEFRWRLRTGRPLL